jgi:ketosteroid isomerase-like protein
VLRGPLGADTGRAMSQENVEVVRRQFEAFEHGGLEAVAEFWHPNIEWRAIEGALDDVGLMRGHDALRRYYQDWIDTLDQLHADVEEVIFDADERVAVVVRNSGRGRASGVRTAGRYYVTCTVRDDQIVSGREYETRGQALEAVGLSE